jgi:hypothetical protein
LKSYEEMAREADAMKDTDAELEGLVPVQARVAKEPRAVFSLRLAPSELTKISEAAREKGLNVSDFIRMAALAAAESKPESLAVESWAALRDIWVHNLAIRDDLIKVFGEEVRADRP